MTIILLSSKDWLTERSGSDVRITLSALIQYAPLTKITPLENKLEELYQIGHDTPSDLKYYSFEFSPKSNSLNLTECIEIVVCLLKIWFIRWFKYMFPT